jgi:hypothetical protein
MRSSFVSALSGDGNQRGLRVAHAAFRGDGQRLSTVGRPCYLSLVPVSPA